MYKRQFSILLAIAITTVLSPAMAADDHYFVGFSSGRVNYSHNDTGQKDGSSLLEFTVGQYFPKNIFVSATYQQFEKMDINDNVGKTDSNYDISGIRFSIGKDIAIYDNFSTSVDVGVLRWTEKQTIKSTDSANPVETTTSLEDKGYSLGIGLNLNMTLSDMTKVSLRLKGDSTDDFGFKAIMLGMQFDI